MSTRRRAAGALVAAVLAAVLPLVLVSAPAGAAVGCTPVPPQVVGGDQHQLVVKVPDCSSGGNIGFRLYEYLDAAATPEQTIDLPVGTTQVTVPNLTGGSVYRFRAASMSSGGVSPKSTLSAAAPMPYRLVSAFAAESYVDFTDKPVTSAQKADWVATVGAYPSTRTMVDAIDGLQKGAYWQVQSPVIRLFQAYFLRLPDVNGLGYWVGKSRSGSRLGRISSYFAGSGEFRNRYGSLSNAAFVDLIYRNVLGRPGDAAGISYWVKKLDAKTKSRGDVMVGFSESNEYKTKTAAQVDVVNVFTGMVRRVPSTEELDTWRPQTRAALIAFLLDSAEYAGRVRTVAPPTVDTLTVPGGLVGKPYPATQITTSFGLAPITFSAASGTLPPGLTLSPTGLLTGTPTKRGVYDVGVRAVDVNGSTGGRGYTIAVQDLDITSPSVLPQATLRVPYSYEFTTADAVAPVYFSSSDPQPPGLAVEGTTISGTPTATGTWTFMVEGQDAAGHRAEAFFTITVVAPTDPLVYTPSLPPAPQGSSYAAMVSAVGGTGAHTWSVSSGSLPAGLSIDPATGAISGTATTAGTATFTLRATDTVAHIGEHAYTLQVAAATAWPQTAGDSGHRSWSPVEEVLTPEVAGSTGAEWRASLGADGLAVADGLAYVTSPRPEDPSGYQLAALDAGSGALVWRVLIDPADCTPGDVAVHGTSVFVACGSSVRAYGTTGAHALEWASGSAAPEAAHLLFDGASVLAWGSGGVSALDPADGSRRWRRAAPGSATATDVAAGSSRVVVAWSDRLEGLVAATGATSWSTAVVTPKVVVAAGAAYSSESGGITRRAVADGAVVWTVAANTGALAGRAGLAGSATFAVHAVDDQHVYVTDQTTNLLVETYLTAVDVADGSLAWYSATVGPSVRSVAVAGDVAWVLDDGQGAYGQYSSALIAYRRSTGTVLQDLEYLANSTRPLAVAQGRVFHRSYDTVTAISPYAGVPGISPRVLPTAYVGASYSFAIPTFVLPDGPAWSVAGGALPAGLVLDPDGTLHGTPSAAGTARVTLRVTNAAGRTNTAAFTVQVDAAASAITPTSFRTLVQSWKTAAPAVPAGWTPDVTREPIVAGSRMYETAADGVLRAFDTTGTATDRTAVWQAPADSGHRWASAPTLVAGTLYVQDDAGTLAAVRASDGVRLWTRALPGVTALASDQVRAPLVVGGRVVTIDAGGQVRAVDASTGALGWGPTDVAAAAVPGGRLATDGVRAYAVVGCWVHAITLATGVEAWSAPIGRSAAEDCNAGGGTMGEPTVADGVVVAGSTAGTAAFDLATGSVRWRSAAITGGGSAVAHGLLLTGRLPWASGPPYSWNLTALDLATGTTMWTGSRIFGTPIVIGDQVVAVWVDRIATFSLLDGSSGSYAPNTVPGNVDVQGRPVVVGGRIYVATARDGVRTWALP